MSRDDAILAFERHATSKIKAAEDLEAILTLGFRGEALASIASVAKVRLRTQREGEMAGTEVEISGGRLLNVRDIAFSRGAEFEIRDLFFNVPARRKFLKSEATESYHITNLVTHYALANSQLSFTLTNNNRESLRLTPAADLRERAYQIFGGAFIDPRTRQLLNERAITVWLDAPIDVLAERTSRRDNRPLLRKGNRSQTLSRLSEQRGPMYQEAHIHIRSGTGAHSEVVNAIVAALEDHLAT